MRVKGLFIRNFASKISSERNPCLTSAPYQGAPNARKLFERNIRSEKLFLLVFLAALTLYLFLDFSKRTHI